MGLVISLAPVLRWLQDKYLSLLVVEAMIDQAMPELTQMMLDKGIDPNGAMMSRFPPSLTLADEVLWRSIRHLKTRNATNVDDILRNQHHVMSLLVSGNGRLQASSSFDWTEWESACTKLGLDCGVFRAAGFPLWLLVPDRTTSARGRTTPGRTTSGRTTSGRRRSDRIEAQRNQPRLGEYRQG